MAGWDGRMGQTIWYKGGMEGPKVAGAILGVPPLALEVQIVEGNIGCHHFHMCWGGSGVFVSVHKTDNNTMHTNPN